ncbi:hypothetical protein M0802_015298 [Mischocyttarus mexicanus]|nr:hypothetical protein M0802_015298 [Mischocyttarus mexicanus]
MVSVGGVEERYPDDGPAAIKDLPTVCGRRPFWAEFIQFCGTGLKKFCRNARSGFGACVETQLMPALVVVGIVVVLVIVVVLSTYLDSIRISSER